MLEENPTINKAIQRLVYVSSDEQLRYDMEMREKAELDYYNDISDTFDRGKEEGLAEGREEGLAEGREEGLAEGRETIAGLEAELLRLRKLLDKQL